MVGISKANVMIAAVVAFGLVTVDDTASGLAKSSPAVTQFQDARDEIIVQEAGLRARAAAALEALVIRQNAKSAEPVLAPAAQSKCGDQTWPYYSGDCLVQSKNDRSHAAVQNRHDRSTCAGAVIKSSA